MDEGRDVRLRFIINPETDLQNVQHHRALVNVGIANCRSMWPPYKSAQYFRVSFQNHTMCSCQDKGIQLFIQCIKDKIFFCDTILITGKFFWTVQMDGPFFEPSNIQGLVLNDSPSSLTMIKPRTNITIPDLRRPSNFQLPAVVCIIFIRCRELRELNFSVENHAKKILSFQKQMLDSGIHSDVTIKVGDNEIQAHRNILASRSRVFAAMFQTPLKERETGVIEIEEFDFFSVRAMLVYMYCAETEAIKGHEADVFVLADMYDLPDLKDYCINELSKVVSKDNFLHLADLAHKYNSHELLKKCCLIFSASRNEIMESDAWKLMKEDNKDVAIRILEFFVRGFDADP